MYAYLEGVQITQDLHGTGWMIGLGVGDTNQVLAHAWMCTMSTIEVVKG